MEQLKKSIQSVIDKDRIGNPVFLRCVLNLAGHEGSLLQPTADIVSLSNAWVPSELQSLCAQGDVGATQVTVMVQYVGGQMALLSVNRVESETAIDIMLVGNQGVIYHETPIGRHYLSGTPLVLKELSTVRVGKNAGELSDVIKASLTGGQPVIVEA